MPIDFDALVLAPAMNVFAVPISVAPLKSQPGAPAYAARGIWDAKPMTIYIEGQAPMRTTTLTIGLRLSEFTTPPSQGDQITIGNGGVYTLDTPEYDGQGGVSWAVKAGSPGQETV